MIWAFFAGFWGGFSVCDLDFNLPQGRPYLLRQGQVQTAYTKLVLLASSSELLPRPTIQSSYEWCPHSSGKKQACVCLAGRERMRTILSRAFPHCCCLEAATAAPRIP